MKTFCIIDYFVKQDVRSSNRLKLYWYSSTRQTVHNIHKLLRIWYKCKWCLLIWVSFRNECNKKQTWLKKKTCPGHLELKKKKLAPLGTENKKTFLARLEKKKKKLVLTQTSCSPPPLKSNGASLSGIRSTSFTMCIGPSTVISMQGILKKKVEKKIVSHNTSILLSF